MEINNNHLLTTSNTYTDKEFFVLDVTVVMGPVIDTVTTRHLEEEEARKAFTAAVNEVIDDKFVVRLLRVSAIGMFDEIARYHSPS